MELPPDITYEEAMNLEVQARAGEKKLGKGPPPQPVPDVKKLATKEERRDKPKPPARGSKESKGKAQAAAKAGGAGSAMLKAVGSGKVAQYLAAKAAPVLQRGFGRLQKLSQNERTHDDAGEKRAQAEQAVVIPPSEGQAKSNTGQVDHVSARPAPPVDENKARQKLQESLKENIPRKIEDVDNFKRDQKAQHMGADVMKVVLSDKNAVVSTYEDMGHTPAPAPREHEPEALPPQEGAPPTGAMDLGKDAIAPLQKEHTDVSNFTKEGDSKLKEEGVSQEQLDMVDSGDLAKANKEKKGMEAAAKTEPLAVEKFAQQQGASVDRDLKEQENKQRVEMNRKRKAGLSATQRQQLEQKEKLQKKRDEVAAKINGIFNTAQDKVKKRLADLETESMKRFDDGNAKAAKEFEDNVNREIEAFKDDRYSGWFGWARKVRDWVKGIDDLPEVKAIFDRNRATFVATIDKLSADIAADNKRVIQECKDQLQNARTQIKEYVDKLEPALKDIGKKTAGEMNSKLNELDKFVAKKEEELQEKLKDKQTAAIKAIDEKIEKMKEAMAGALAKLGKLLLLAAKKFFTWALEKVGFSLSDIEDIINKGVAVLKAIFTQPIQFVKNLMRAAITGFENFGKNFLKHLQDALFEWLTGSLEGIKLPTSWDPMGILGVALQMIGISYQHIRKHMVTVMTEPVVRELERGFTLVQTLIKEGPMAAWEQLKDMAGEMKDAFIDAVKDFIKQKIIEEAIKWIVSLFIPGAGIVKAIIGIYDTVVFFIQKAKQIMQMISSFLGSIAEIAAGNIGAAADAMEKGLARGLSLVISFLAQLLHLSGITNKIKTAIKKIENKVDAVMLKVAKWIAAKAKALFQKGVGAVKSGVAAVLQWWNAKKKFKAGAATHTLFFKGEGQAAVPMISSVEESLEHYFQTTLKPKHADSKPEMVAIRQQIGVITTLRKKDKMSQKDGEALAQCFEVIAPNIEALEGGEIPQSEVDWDPPHKTAGSDLGKGMRARILSMRAGKNFKGSSPYDSTPVWKAICARKDTYVRGHLLNHNLHGPGSNQNMAPITIKLNNAMKDDVETPLKNLVFAERKVMSYSVVFDYRNAHPSRNSDPLKNWIDEEKYLPVTLEMHARELIKTNAGKWDELKGGKKLDKTTTAHVLPKDVRPTGIPVVNLNKATEAELDAIPGIGPARAKAIIALRTKRLNEGIVRFHSYADLKDAGIPPDILKWIIDQGRITLF